MNVMENFFDLIETLSWNSTKPSLDINMITLARRREAKRVDPLAFLSIACLRQPDEPERDLSKMSLTRICLKSLSSTPSRAGHGGAARVPRLVPRPARLRSSDDPMPKHHRAAEISRQSSRTELKKRFDKYLSMMPGHADGDPLHSHRCQNWRAPKTI